MTVESVVKSTHLVTDVVARGHEEEAIVPIFIEELDRYAPREAKLVRGLYSEILADPDQIRYHPEWWSEVTALSFHLTQRLNHHARGRGEEFVMEQREEDNRCACVWGYRPVLLRNPCSHI